MPEGVEVTVPVTATLELVKFTSTLLEFIVPSRLVKALFVTAVVGTDVTVTEPIAFEPAFRETLPILAEPATNPTFPI